MKVHIATLESLSAVTDFRNQLEALKKYAKASGATRETTNSMTVARLITEGILMGNARILTQWLGVASHTGLRVDITKSDTDIIINVSYESSLWPAEFARWARAF